MLYNNKVYLYLRSEDIHNEKYTLDEVYTADMTAFQRERYNRVADEFEKLSVKSQLLSSQLQAELR